MAIVRALQDCTLGTSIGVKHHKKGDQKQVTDEFAKFLVEKSGKWEYVQGQARTEEEQKVFDAVAAEEKGEEPKKKRTRKK